MNADSDNWFDLDSPGRGANRLGIDQSEIWLEQYVYADKPMADDAERIALSVSVISGSLDVTDPTDPDIVEEVVAHLSTENLVVSLSRLNGGGADALDGITVDVPGEGKPDLGFYDSPGFLATPTLSELTRLSLAFKRLDRKRYDLVAKGESEAGERFSLRTVAPLKGVILQVGKEVEKSTVEAYFAHVFDASGMEATWKEPGFRWDWALQASFRDGAQGISE